MGYPVLAHPLVRQGDVPSLGAAFDLSKHEMNGLLRRLVELVAELEHEPRIGREMRPRPGYEILADCHSLPFDEPSWHKKARYRIVYKIDPGVEAITRVLIYAVGPRPNLEAYKRARDRRRAGDWP
jgi:hypothetical protein